MERQIDQICVPQSPRTLCPSNHASIGRFSCSLPVVFLPRRVITLRQCLI
jgi:hypothetical protein